MSMTELERRCVDAILGTARSGITPTGGMVAAALNHTRAVLAEAGVAEMVEALEGCLHFDDGFIRGGASGDALKQWRYAAEAALAKIGATQ